MIGGVKGVAARCSEARKMYLSVVCAWRTQGPHIIWGEVNLAICFLVILVREHHNGRGHQSARNNNSRWLPNFLLQFYVR